MADVRTLKVIPTLVTNMYVPAVTVVYWKHGVPLGFGIRLSRSVSAGAAAAEGVHVVIDLVKAPVAVLQVYLR
jgi:hypothetical protein